MTPEIRCAAIKKMAEGALPSSLGTILPSLHQDHLRALFLGPMSKVDLFLKPSNNGNNAPNNVEADTNSAIVYFEQWSIKEVMNQVRATFMPQNTPTTDDEELKSQQDFAVELVQNRVSRALAKLQDKVHGWRSYDAIKEQRERDALEVVVNDPLTQQPGALEYLAGHWRVKLGWRDPAVGYWFDTAAAIVAQQRFKFVAYGRPMESGTMATSGAEPSSQTTTNDNEDDMIKYFWSETSGTWKTAGGLKQEKEKIQHDRNAWLVSEIGRIEKERDDDLIMERVGFILPYLNGLGNQDTNTGEWSGGVGQQGQKSTRRRKIKKQTPQRRFGSVDFVPEDGGKTVFDALADPALTEGIVQSIEYDTTGLDNVTTTSGLQKLTPVVPPKKIPDPSRQQIQAAQSSTVTKKGGKKGAKKQQSRRTIQRGNQASGKRKRSQESGDETETSAPTRAATRAVSALATIQEDEEDEEPQKKKPKLATGRAQAMAALPPPMATRKSSRIAKRKTTEEPEEDGPTKNPSPTKRRKIEPKPQSQKSDTREATLSAEPQTSAVQGDTTSAKKAKRGDSLKTQDAQQDSSIQATTTTDTTGPNNTQDPTTANNNVDTSNENDNDDISSYIDPANVPDFEAAAAATLPAQPNTQDGITPHRPTSQLLISPSSSSSSAPAQLLTPPSPTTTATLMTRYPFLSQLPSTAAPAPATTSSGSASASTQTQPTQSRLTHWLSFLHVFGSRSDRMSASINAWFAQDSNAVGWEREYLDELLRCVAKVKRVDGGGQGDEEKYVLLD